MEKNIASISKEKFIAYQKKWGPGEDKLHGTVLGQCFMVMVTVW